MTYDLSSLGWDDTFAAAYAPLNRCDAAPARVLRADPGVCTVLGADGVSRASLAGSVLLGAARDPAGLPCAGDWVVVRRWPDRRNTVEAVLPRRTALTGVPGDAGRAGQVLAANMDVVAVVQPARPDPEEVLLHRLIARVRASGARPVVLLSTSDDTESAATVHRLTGLVPGVPVLTVDVLGGGPGAVPDFVGPGQTLGLLGGCGAERSALIAALAGATVLPAGTPPPPRTSPSPRTSRPSRRPLLTRTSAPQQRGGTERSGATERTGGATDAADSRLAARRVLVPVPGGGAVLDIAGVAGDEEPFQSATGSAGTAAAVTGVPTGAAAAVPAPAARALRTAARLAAVAGGASARSRPSR
jgi:ribosome biogenesis GTPase